MKKREQKKEEEQKIMQLKNEIAQQKTSGKGRAGSRSDSVTEKRPWRAGSVSQSRAYSRTSTFIDEQGNKIDSKMIKRANELKAKGKSGRRKSRFDFGPAPDRYVWLTLFKFLTFII